MTVSNLIKSTLKLLGVIASNETPNANDQNDTLANLTEMLDSWSAQGILINSTTTESFTLLSQVQMTVGPTGNFVTTRPSEIIKATVKQNNVEQEIKLISIEQWALISDKTLSSSLPQYLYVQGTFPNETLNFWPIPNTANTLTLYSRKPFTALVLTDTLTFPPGYQEAIRYNLAKKIGPEFGKVLSPELQEMANESLATLKRKNSDAAVMVSDAFGLTNGSRFNIFTGE